MNKKKTGKIGIIITIIIIILLVTLSNTEINNLSFAENAVNAIIMPIQNGLTYLKNKISGNQTFFASIDELKKENDELKVKNSEIEKSLRELEIIKAENETLKQYLNLTEKYSTYTTTPAYIISKDTSNYNNIFIINVGEKDGIKQDMTVIADKGLVGHIISTTENTSKVQTIISTSNTVSATLGTSRDNVICRGTLNNNELKATYISTYATVAEGENIETSGMGGIYPKGIHIGTVKQIVNTKNITDRTAIITPAVDFNKVETVLVITN